MFEHRIDEDVTLRPVELHDADAIFALVDANREYLRRWLSWVDASVSVHDTRRYVESAMQQWASNNGYQASIWYQGRIVGMIGQVYIDWTNRATELGYWLSAEFQGRGIMTRACRTYISFAFEKQQINRVQIRCAMGNTRSCAIPQRLGFQQEGIIRDAEWLYDHFVDILVYGMLARDWQKRDH